MAAPFGSQFQNRTNTRSVCRCCGNTKERDGSMKCGDCAECQTNGVAWKRAGACAVLRRSRLANKARSEQAAARRAT